MNLPPSIQPISNIDLAMDALRRLQDESPTTITASQPAWMNAALFWLGVAKASGATPEVLQAHTILLADTLGKADGQGMIPHFLTLTEKVKELATEVPHAAPTA